MFSRTKKRGQKKTNTRRRQKAGSRIDFNDDAAYKENVYDTHSFALLKQYGEQIKDNQMIHDPKASGRAMYVIANDDPIIQIICNKALLKQVREITGNPRLKPCLTIPIEYRKYVIGSYMDWHKDTQMLPTQLQYECVITLTNSSDSSTLLKYDSGIKKLVTKPNSILIVRANGISHKVTPLTVGTRTIIKLVFAE